jgi:hypothetical protein
MEGLVVGALWAVAQRVGGRWIDDIAERVDVGLRDTLRRLSKAVDLTDAGERDAEASAATHDLEEYISKNPSTAGELVEAASMPVKTSRLIDQYASFLVFTTELVARLGRPVALPGFFNCTSCVSVIDARPPSGELSALEVSEPLGSGDPTIYLMPNEAYQLDIPRLWLIRVESDARRDDLVGQLNDRFWPLPPDPGTFRLAHFDPDVFGLGEGETAERILSINSDRVSVDNSASTDRYTAITDAAGLIVFRRFLAELAQAEEDRRASLRAAASTHLEDQDDGPAK